MSEQQYIIPIDENNRIVVGTTNDGAMYIERQRYYDSGVHPDRYWGYWDRFQDSFLLSKKEAALFLDEMVRIAKLQILQ